MTGPLHAAILAGGAASRFGGAPKGLLPVGGRRILDRVVDVCLEVTGALPLLVANDPGAGAWRPDLRVVSDRRPGSATLGGLHAAVSAAPAPVLCVAWDMPFLSAPLLRLLAERLAAADAVLPASGGPRGVEPLCAGYGPGCLAPMERALDCGDFRAVAFLPEVRVTIVPEETVRTFGDPDVLFFNVNTPQDLERAESIAAA
jgi:molybdopterin-guanine dinucleotide biosynthesis protein A